MKYVNIILDIYINCGVEHDDKDPKFKVEDHVKISNKKFLPMATFQIFLKKFL